MAVNDYTKKLIVDLKRLQEDELQTVSRHQVMIKEAEERLKERKAIIESLESKLP